MYVYCVEIFLISSATEIGRAGGGAFGRTPLLRCYLMFVVQSLYSVMYRTRVALVCLVCSLLCKVEA